MPGKDAMRYDNSGNVVHPVQVHTRRKCMSKTCKSVVRIECCKCDVGSGFASYHKQNSVVSIFLQISFCMW